MSRCDLPETLGRCLDLPGSVGTFQELQGPTGPERDLPGLPWTYRDFWVYQDLAGPVGACGILVDPTLAGPSPGSGRT